MINKKEKSAHGAATPLGTQLNRQEQYSTDRQKSEIRKIVTEIFDLSLRLQEMTDGTIDWREPGVPCVQAEYHGATAVLSVRIWEDGFNAEVYYENSSDLTNILWSVGPFILLIVFWIYLARRMTNQGGGGSGGALCPGGF